MKNTNKIIGIIGTILVIFLLLNFYNIKNFYYNVSGNYEKTDNLEGKYNLATKYYLKNNYDDAINTLSGALSEEKNEINFRGFYLLGNADYKKSQLQTNDKIKFLKKSVENYEKSLDIKFDEQVQKNLEFVKEKLRIAKLEEQNKKSSPQSSSKDKKEKEQNSSGDKEKGQESDENQKGKGQEQTGQDGDKSGKSGQDGDKSGKSGQENGKNLEGNDKSGQDNGLSKETKKILEQREQELKNKQGDIGKYYNKVYQENKDPFNNFDDFFNNPFFDNSSLNKDSGEKDW